MQLLLCRVCALDQQLKACCFHEAKFQLYVVHAAEGLVVCPHHQWQCNVCIDLSQMCCVILHLLLTRCGVLPAACICLRSRFALSLLRLPSPNSSSCTATATSPPSCCASRCCTSTWPAA
jgi:hypothetical protein